jgi:drug/metabolite transporter (DMT)-like permease
MSSIFAGLAALAFGAADYAGGRATRRHNVMGVLTASQFVGLTGIVLVALLLGHSFAEPRDLVWGAVAGLSGVTGLAMLYYGLAHGATAIVSPTAALLGTGLPVIAGMLFGEAPDLLAWIGIGLALPAILLLSLARDPDQTFDVRSLLLGVAAGSGFGGYFILIDQTDPGSGFWPLAAARVASLLMLLLLGALSRRRAAGPFLPRNRALGAAVVAGALDMTANVFFLLAARAGMLITSAVIASMYPAPTVILARVRDDERLGTRRIAGLLLALVGVALISI